MSGWLVSGQNVRFKLGNLTGQIVDIILPRNMFVRCNDGQIWISGYSTHEQLETLVKFNMRLPDGNLIKELSYSEIDWTNEPYFVKEDNTND